MCNQQDHVSPTPRWYIPCQLAVLLWCFSHICESVRTPAGILAASEEQQQQLLTSHATSLTNICCCMVFRDAIYCEGALTDVLADLKDIISLNMHFIGQKQVECMAGSVTAAAAAGSCTEPTGLRLW